VIETFILYFNGFTLIFLIIYNFLFLLKRITNELIISFVWWRITTLLICCVMDGLISSILAFINLSICSLVRTAVDLAQQPFLGERINLLIIVKCNRAVRTSSFHCPEFCWIKIWQLTTDENVDWHKPYSLSR